MKPVHKIYDKETDERSRQALPDIIQKLEKLLKEKIVLTKSGSLEDYKGIDAKTESGKTIQFKNYNYCKYNGIIYSNTIVCPIKNFKEYVENDIDLLFSAYYMDNDPSKIIQYGLIEINKLKDIKPDINRLIYKSDHYIWNYSNPEIKKKAIIYKYVDEKEDECLL
tara:strand:+ start:96 stop:593 length:498 start_codon:yes stop_codon:yes gene_type:complete